MPSSPVLARAIHILRQDSTPSFPFVCVLSASTVPAAPANVCCSDSFALYPCVPFLLTPVPSSPRDYMRVICPTATYQTVSYHLLYKTVCHGTMFSLAFSQYTARDRTPAGVMIIRDRARGCPKNQHHLKIINGVTLPYKRVYYCALPPVTVSRDVVGNPCVTASCLKRVWSR